MYEAAEYGWGHSTISMTLDIYSHVLTDMQRDAVDALDTLPADGGSRAEEPPDIVE